MHVVPKTETASPATETASNVPGPRPALDGAEAFRRSIGERLLYATGKDPATVSGHDWLWTLSHVTRDRLVERWIETSRRHHREDAKRVYYLSMEFLMGRALSNGLLALGLYDQCKEALVGLGLDLDELKEHEPDPGLGNGGLGRLAACFLDSMATRGIAGTGYGIRYEYGMFAQRIFEGRQVEQPDAWLANGNPWEFPRPEVTYRVQFGGRVERDAGGKVHWVDSDDIKAMAYDTLVPGYGAETVNALRLWSAKPIRDLDMPLFNEGKHAHAVDHKNRCENISRVLYPDDSTPQGRELRLQQEYFFCSASLQDILHRYIQDHDGWDELPDKVAIHLNDTHPALAVPELMRLLVDQHGLDWDYAWSLCQGVFSYTNHTLMPEALETWPVSLVGALLPRHLEIVYALNDRFLREVSHRRGDDWGLLSRVSLIDEEGEKRVRMANLCALASHKVNGVSKLHSELLKQTIFADFEQLFPGRFINKTNGITPRRWLNQANPSLSRLVDSQIGHGWRHDLDLLEGLKRHADDASFRAAFRDVKRANKERLAALVMRETGVAVDPSSLFDVQVKRIHEYKRQLLNLLQVVARYQRILAEPHADWVPRTVLFAGKAASGYWMAKLIIKLIHDVARRINADTRTNDKLKVVFIPNYGVSVAEAIIAGADLSEQISTAGTEASGTGNMKLALNGALTIGTEDGANIEIRENVGHENIFVFGHTAEEIRALKERGYEPWHVAQADPLLRDVLDKIGHGFFSAEEPDRFRPIVDGLMNGDRYFLLADFGDYMAAQDLVDATWRMPEVWTRRAVLNVASMGSFSSDRTIREYAEEIWRIGPRHR